MKELSVSAAIIVISRDMRALILQRKPGDSFPNKWTVPGGKLKDSDFAFAAGRDFCYYVAENAAIRELMEETGIEVKAENLRFLCTLYLKEINRLVVSFYSILDEDSERMPVKLSGSKACKWIGRNGIKDYDFIPDIGSEIEAAYRSIEEG